MKRKKTKRESFFESRIILIIFIFLVIFLGKAVWERYQKGGEAREARTISERKLKELEEREEKLEQKIEKLETERGVEEIIRENFDVAKEGEGVIIMVNEDGEETKEKTEEKSLWQKIIDIFQ